MALSLGAASAQAEEMVFTSWGGTTQDAQKQAWAEPFTQATGIAVLQDGPTDYGKLKAMVEAAMSWDVVDVEHDFAIKAAADGLLEPLDFQAIDKSTIDPRFVTDHAVGSFYYSFVLAYNQDAGRGGPPTWADLFDLEKFPDKRTFYKWSAPGAIEIALLADGVAPDKLYRWISTAPSRSSTRSRARSSGGRAAPSRSSSLPRARRRSGSSGTAARSRCKRPASTSASPGSRT